MFTDLVTVRGVATLVTGRWFAPDDAAWLRSAATSSVVAAVAQSAGRCQVRDSVGHHWDSGDIAYGVQCVGIVPHPAGWEVTWMQAPVGGSYGRTVLDPELREIAPRTSTPCADTSQGFWNVALGAEPIWADTQTFVRFPGLTLSHWTTVGPWTIGQDRTSGARVSGWHSGRQQAYEIARIDTPTPSHLVIDGAGEAVVAVGFTDVLVRESQFVPWRPWVEPPVAIGRPLWFGWFEFSAPELGAVPPSSCVLPITQGAPWNTVVDLQGRPIARYTAGSPDSDMDSLDAAVRAAQAGSSLPVIGYWTRAAQTTGRVPASEIAGVEAYWHVDETEAAYESRLRSSVARCRRAALIVQVYTSNATNIADLTAIPAPVSRVARDCPQVEMILGFSGAGRATGYQDHPEAWDAWMAVFRGIPGVPSLPQTVPDLSTPAPTPAPPKKGRPVQHTDSITYQQAHDGLAPRADGRHYTDGALDAYRLMAEGTPLADVLAGTSKPSQTPWPKLAYPQAASMAVALEATRRALGKGTGYQDAVLDLWRIFGPEHWPVAFVLADLAGGVLPAQPFADPF